MGFVEKYGIGVLFFTINSEIVLVNDKQSRVFGSWARPNSLRSGLVLCKIKKGTFVSQPAITWQNALLSKPLFKQICKSPIFYMKYLTKFLHKWNFLVGFYLIISISDKNKIQIKISNCTYLIIYSLFSSEIECTLNVIW